MLNIKFGKAQAIILTGLIAESAIADEGAHGTIAVRMNAMKNMQQKLKAIGEMLVGKRRFDPASIRRHAEILRENCHMIGACSRRAASIIIATPNSPSGTSVRLSKRTFGGCIKRAEISWLRLLRG